MGEPLANYDNLWAAIERLHDDVGMSARHLTVSTVGIVPGIKRLAVASLPVNLAVSLHAANDELRDELVPINRRYPLAVLQEACAAYIAATRRRLSFEWALIDGVNDTRKDARELAGIAPRSRRPREPHPAQSDTGLRGARHAGGGRRGLQRPASLARRERHGALDARRRDRRRLRSTGRLDAGDARGTRRARRRAALSSSVAQVSCATDSAPGPGEARLWRKPGRRRRGDRPGDAGETARDDGELGADQVSHRSRLEIAEARAALDHCQLHRGEAAAELVGASVWRIVLRSTAEMTSAQPATANRHRATHSTWLNPNTVMAHPRRRQPPRRRALAGAGGSPNRWSPHR